MSDGKKGVQVSYKVGEAPYVIVAGETADEFKHAFDYVVEHQDEILLLGQQLAGQNAPQPPVQQQGWGGGPQGTPIPSTWPANNQPPTPNGWGGQQSNDPQGTCPQCGKPLKYRTGKTSVGAWEGMTCTSGSKDHAIWKVINGQPNPMWQPEWTRLS